MGCAKVISLSEVRASSQWQRLRDDLHARFDRWLDRLQAQLPNPQTHLAEVTEAVWSLRQDLTTHIPHPCGWAVHVFSQWHFSCAQPTPPVVCCRRMRGDTPNTCTPGE
jgi:hypothetical protein